MKRNAQNNLSAKTRLVLISIIVAVGIFVGGYLVGRFVTSTQTGNGGDKITPFSFSGSRKQMTVAGTDWRYSVKSDLEQKFTIKVEKATGPNEEVLISGYGCNTIFNRVVSDADMLVDKKQITIDGKDYYLSPGVSTRKACTGESASLDQELAAEIDAIFYSLKK